MLNKEGKALLSKIEDIVSNTDDATNIDAGIMVNDDVSYNYLIVAFDDRYEVYLYNDEKDILVKGTSKYLADAKEKAVNELDKNK